MTLRIRNIVLILGILGVSTAQKGSKHGQHQHGGGTGPAYPSNQNQYSSNPYQGNYNTHGGANAVTAKPNYPLLLSDSRTLNNDGTINFQYAADNGLQQGETVDPDGTRRGFYSYPGADGKPITVKYTAGKNGFVAEGDHLPKQPNVPAHSDKDEGAEPYRGPSPQQGNYQSRGHSPQEGNYPSRGHSPQEGNYPTRGHSPQPYRPQQSPATSSPYHDADGRDNGQYNPAYNSPEYKPAEPPRYTGQSGPSYRPSSRPEGGDYRGISPAGFFGRGQGFDFGSANYGSPSQNSVNRYKPAAVPQSPPRQYAPNNGQSYSAANPHQGPGGPYKGQFDLGNGGQFTINFNPGQSREVPVGGDYGRAPQEDRY